MDQHPAGDGDAAGSPRAQPRGEPLEEQATALRATARDLAALQARQLRQVARLAADCEAEARAMLAVGPRVPGQPSDEEVVRSAATGELMVVLGIAEGAAGRLVRLADRLTRVLPDTLVALAEGRLDLPRAQVLAGETEVLADEAARRVQAMLLAGAGDAAWAGPSPRAWKARVQRAVVRVDVEAALRRREWAVANRAVRTWAVGDGTGVLQLTAADNDIAMADRVVTDLAHARPATGPDGQRVSMDQRRADALTEVFRRIHDGQPLPTIPDPDDPDGAVDNDAVLAGAGPSAAARQGTPRPGREVGIVLHADTLFGDGPAAAEPGELRGLGAPAPIDPASAAALARADIAAGVRARVLLVGADGVLARVVSLGSTPAAGWSRHDLTAAVRAALPGLPSLRTDRYQPTAAIAGHVRAAHPTCGSYDCPRAAYRCDLDHDTPWPRGPTDAACLCPRCRRHHEHKTRGLVRTRLHPERSLTTVMLTGLTVTTRPEPLPGCGPG